MPRSFLVKTHSSHRVPNYGQLETQREIHGACSTCGGLVVPFLPTEEAPSAPADLPRLWGHTSALARTALPLLLDNEGALGTSGPEPLEMGPPRAGRALGAPLKDSLNHLNLPMRWPPTQGPSGDGAPGRLPRAEQAARAPGDFDCAHCRQPCHALAGLHRHGQLRAGRVFTCRHCGKEYASLGALKMHIRTHTLPCVCMLCGKAFSRPWLLQGHIRTHTGEKPYACPHCSRAFADRSNLRAHLQTHSDAKRYPCAACARTFSRVSLLVRHQGSGCCSSP
ncbi:zinc finger protein SNAI3 [Tupaia chinensis]|uniref:zinc finger protein SNAI3 n=1 Tax=Tupaia chinensis TaxID=246437 RepID=UPI0003C8F8E2|nr:zinc finger protein SNAI3 [Tupaia chinensis]